MYESKKHCTENRLPYVWHSRAMHFNKQIVKKLHDIPRCKSKTRVRNSDLFQKRNGALRQLLIETSQSNTSASPSVSSDDRDEVPFVHRPYSQRIACHNVPVSKMNRTYQENGSPLRGYPPGQGTRCPLHRQHQVSGQFSSLTDLREYASPANYFHPYLYSPEYLSRYRQNYYSSQYYLPTSSFYPMQLMSPRSACRLSYGSPHHYSPKVIPSYHVRSHSYDLSNAMHLLQHRKQAKRKCKGHLVVLIIILTVITIGIIMGLVLAITIN